MSDSVARSKAPVVPGSLLAQMQMQRQKEDLAKEAKRAKDSLQASTKRLTDNLSDFKKSREPCSKSSKGSSGTRLPMLCNAQPMTSYAWN